MNEQLNNQSSQLSNSILALSRSISEQNKKNVQDLNNVQSILEELEPFYLGTINNPASSCSDIPQDRPSGEYWIATNSTSSPVQVYCDLNRTSCSCNTTGGWTRVANLDMTDPNQNCPEGLRLETRTEPPLRTNCKWKDHQEDVLPLPIQRWAGVFKSLWPNYCISK